ncbi:lipocalin family protein [Empedobacter falsenii]|uniref:lipocalin family protein n=1 Tax=Empedobacter falsenii TaxID=343874 RepID=UPI000EF12BC3|nr:lipocalin family protein [Empedobacter falsenii]MDM1298465.1 lipocalin family protein [Empedobacter falsenii]MDM1318258.1 lipocalin family protein [Empedobacter falsenii]HAD80256.1 hypothetical protein [Flavobacteriaceae bacterium]
MKKLLLFAVLSATTFFSSCNNDDDSNISQSDLLQGTWKIKDEGYVENGKDVSYNLTSCDLKTTLEFTNDKFISEYYEGDEKETCYHSTGKGTWKLDGDKLSTTDQDGDNSVIKVEKLTKNEFIYRYDDGDYAIYVK